jgi:hypothetical protein
MVQWIDTRTPQRGGFRARLLAGLRAWSAGGEPVELVEQRFNFLPQRFRWRGVHWRVRQISAIWEHARGRQQARRYFRVICQDDTQHMLYQDLTLGTWHVRL